MDEVAHRICRPPRTSSVVRDKAERQAGLCGLSSRTYDSGSTPRAWTLPNKAAERLIEMRLIRQTAVDRDLGERQVCLQQQALRALNSPPHHISVWWFIEALSKGSAEMGHALFRHPSQI